MVVSPGIVVVGDVLGLRFLGCCDISLGIQNSGVGPLHHVGFHDDDNFHSCFGGDSFSGGTAGEFGYCENLGVTF